MLATVMDSPARVLAAPVQILDVNDAEGFVQATINRWQAPTPHRGRIELSEYEREELAAEGMAILCKLRDQFKPRMEGYAQDGRFSGYAAQFLPRKLGDAWHRMHDEHQLRTQVDGGRKWFYGEKAASLEAMTADEPDRHPVMKGAMTGHNWGPAARSAYLARRSEERPLVIKVALLIGAGVSVPDTCERLRLPEELVARFMREVSRAKPHPRHMFTKTSELRGALAARADVDADSLGRVVDLLADGATPGDVAETTNLELPDVRDYIVMTREVWDSIQRGPEE